MWLQRFFVVSFHFVLHWQTFACAADPPKDVDSCVGPSGKLGLCISLKSCPTLFKILREDPIRPSRIKFLQSSTCAFNYEDPWVCCPSEEEEEDDQSKSTASTTVAPANNVTLAPGKYWATTEPPKPLGNHLSLEIEKHRNFKFLPKPQSCGASASQTIDRIIGGTIAGLGTFPWMALLAFKDPAGGFQLACGGTLINALHVLTAAHCVTNLPPGFSVPFVRIGEYDQIHDPDCQDGICAPRHQDIPVAEITSHEKYSLSGKYENDIAVIRLKKRAVIGTFVQPVCLPQGEVLERDSGKEGTATIAGWGRTRSSKPVYTRSRGYVTHQYADGSSVLLQVHIPIVPTERCIEAFKLGTDDHSKICAGGDKGKDSCKGDSGGPLMKAVLDKGTDVVRTYQLGIVSFGPPNCGSSMPAVYTKVSHYIPWILDHLKES